MGTVDVCAWVATQDFLLTAVGNDTRDNPTLCGDMILTVPGSLQSHVRTITVGLPAAKPTWPLHPKHSTVQWPQSMTCRRTSLC
jgi:hypothetical protein